MAPAPLSSAALREAAESLARVPEGERTRLARAASEVLTAQANEGALAPSTSLVNARAQAAGLPGESSSLAAVSQQVLAVLRSAPRDLSERALVSVLLAQHLVEALPKEPDKQGPWLASRVDAHDWLEFNGPYAPYLAARTVLPDEARERLFAALEAAPIEAPSEASLEARKALRGIAPPAPPTTVVVAPAVEAPSPVDDAAPTLQEQLFDAVDRPEDPPRVLPTVSIAGELASADRGWALRLASMVTGYSALRGAALAVLRTVFSLRRPATLTLDGRSLRVLAHTELLGRTLRTYDVQIPINALTEVRREVRYPLLPVATAVAALLLGAILGARAVVEGAGVAYFPLIAIGLGAILLGVVVELLSRALFPGVRGRARLYLRGRDVGAVELTDLPSGELDRLLERLDPAALRRTVISTPGAARAASVPPAAKAVVVAPEPEPELAPTIEAPAESEGARVSNEPPPYKPPPMPQFTPPPARESRKRK